MNVVWHDDIFIQISIWVEGRDSFPEALGGDPNVRRVEFVIDHGTKESFALCCAYGDKVVACTCIVPMRQSGGGGSVSVFKFLHDQM